MAQAARSQIVTAADVKWDNDELFHGYLLLMLGMPTLGGTQYDKAYVRGDNLQQARIPLRVKIPIVEGVLDDSIRVWRNDSIVPPKTVYCAFWYDETRRQIATGPDLFSVTTDEHTIAPPTLSSGTAAGACPDPATATGESQLLTTIQPFVEVASLTTTTATITRTPTVVLGAYLNGQLLVEGASEDYTRSGTVFTVAAHLQNLDTTNDRFVVVYYA